MRCKNCESTSVALDTWWLVTKPPRYDYRFSSRRLERESERKTRGEKAEISGIGGPRRSRDLCKGRAGMNGGDGPGWHVAGGKGVAQDKTIINQIMLRFRPIAPKPAAAGSSSGQTSTEAFGSKRVKRKYIRARKNNSNNRSDTPPEAAVDSAGAATLQLMPGKSGSGDFTGGGSWCGFDPTVAEISEDNREKPWMKMSRSVAAAGEDRPAAVESWVTVESVTDTCMDVRGLGCTDVEKLNSLEKDTCPGFISDGSNRVRWVNNAFKSLVVPEMAGAALINYAGQPQPDPAVVVWLVTKAELPDYYAAFSCRVRVQYYTWQQKDKCSKTVPCDVWRMECGLAWRLDIKAALSLGL